MAVIPMPLPTFPGWPRDSDAPMPTKGRRAPVRMMSRTCTSSFRRARRRDGAWRSRRRLKPRASSSAIASASPSARAAVVLAVGASSSGQASRSTAASRCTSAFAASVEAGLPVIAMIFVPRRLSGARMRRISSVSPELESATTTSSAVIMPRSPWLASPGCMKNAGVPVEASVEAILLPMWPDLPMPVTTTRPRVARTAGAPAGNPRRGGKRGALPHRPRFQGPRGASPRTRAPGSSASRGGSRFAMSQV